MISELPKLHYLLYMLHLQAMQISVTNPTTGTFTLDVESGSSILDVKTKIFEQTNIATTLMTLKFGPTLLEDVNTLSYYGIGKESSLKLILPFQFSCLIPADCFRKHMTCLT